LLPSPQVDRGQAEQSPAGISPKTAGRLARAPERLGGLRREDDGYEEQEELWQVGRVRA
jgi:hypothetical protein